MPINDQNENPSTKDNLFTRHPHSVGETYLEHLEFASISGIKLTFAGIACIIHSIFPFFFENTASETMEKLTAEITARKNKPK